MVADLAGRGPGGLGVEQRHHASAISATPLGPPARTGGAWDFLRGAGLPAVLVWGGGGTSCGACV